MSYQAVNAVLANSKAKGSDRLVLLVLASHANDETFECYPGRDLLCRESAMSERNLIYCLRKLEESKELIVSRGSGRGNLTTYRINLAKVEEIEKVQDIASFNGKKRVQSLAGFLQDSAPFIPEKVQLLASFSPQERVQDSAQRVQDSAQRVQDSVRKGAKSLSAYKDIEPSGTIKEPYGADAPTAEPENQSDPGTVIWKKGVSLLKSGGVAEAGARSLLGKLAKEYGKEQLARAIETVEGANPASPREYLVKVLQNIGKKGKGNEYAEERNRRARRDLARFRTDWKAKWRSEYAGRTEMGKGISDSGTGDGDSEGQDARVSAPSRR